MMSGMAAPTTMFHTGCHDVGGTDQRHGGVGHEHVVEHDGVRAGGPQPERVPGQLDADAVGRERHRAVDDLRAVGRVVPADAGHERSSPTSQPLAGRLAGADPVAAVDPSAVPFEATQSEAPVLTSTAPSQRPCRGPEASMPCLWRHTWSGHEVGVHRRA